MKRCNAVDFSTPMQVQIENLVKLQAVELGRARLTKETAALPAEIKQAEGALSAAQRHSADTSAALDREEALRLLEPLGRQIYASGLGTLSEVFDGDAPFTPRGCIATTRGAAAARMIPIPSRVLMPSARAIR